jgi:leucyl/phenylalanyl-tRNA--protein transferase
MAAFTADDLIACYRVGVFPMGEARDDPRVFLVEPEQRGVIPLDGFHLPRRLARTVRSDAFEVKIDTAFDALVALCAESAADREETWINGPIQRLYGELFQRGQAHSVECWRGDALLGGLYGVSLGGAFFGESMVSRATDASKVALVHLVARLKVGGFRLLDTQFLTEHLARFGAEEMTRARYRRRLQEALAAPADFYALTPGGGGATVLQAISQTS